jgi:hypothetical protein
MERFTKILIVSLLVSFQILMITGIYEAQGKLIGSMNFTPKVDGFRFPNYRNIGNKWQDDLGADDLIRMFGVEPVCKTGDNASNCVVDAAARIWLEKKLKAMDIGRCEGIAVASMRMNSGLPFKKRIGPKSFQPAANSPFDLQLNQTLENYIAYYWVTQTLKEISSEADKTARKGPAAIAEMLKTAFSTKTETYLIGIWKSSKENGKPSDGHAVVPFALEDLGNQYKVSVYDNNFPGETRFLYINKTGDQQWSYVSAANQNGKPDFVGNLRTKTLELTATSLRDGNRNEKCFDAPFAKDDDSYFGCGIERAQLFQPKFMNANYKRLFAETDSDGEDVEFFLTGEGNMLITDNNGNSIGYDENNTRFDEIVSCNVRMMMGGMGIDAPTYTLPFQPTEQTYTITFSGKDLKKPSHFDFVYSAPDFTVGFNDIDLDPGEILTATITCNGEIVEFTSSGDMETPEVFYAYDSLEEGASYIATIGGVSLTANKTLSYEFDFDQGKLYFQDDDPNRDGYNIELIRIDENGEESVFEQDNFKIGGRDRYEMDFGDWDGEEENVCFKCDDDNDEKFTEKCVERSNKNQVGRRP